MLGKPALVARHARGDPQGEALLAQQRIAAIAAAIRPDGAFLGEVDDVLLLGVAGPGDVLLPGPQRHADGVDAGHEEAVAQGVEHRAAHPGHDPHRDGDVGGVRDLHADMRDRRADRSHAEGHDIHGPAAHAAVEEVPQGLLHGDGLDPVIGRSRVIAPPAADERPILDPGHVRRVGEGQVAVRPFFRVQPAKGPLLHKQFAEPVVLLLRAVAPDHLVGLAQVGHLLDPGPELRPFHAHRGQDSRDHGCGRGQHWQPPHALIGKPGATVEEPDGAVTISQPITRSRLPRPDRLHFRVLSWTRPGEERPAPGPPAPDRRFTHLIASWAGLRDVPYVS